MLFVLTGWDHLKVLYKLRETSRCIVFSSFRQTAIPYSSLRLRQSDRLHGNSTDFHHLIDTHIMHVPVGCPMLGVVVHLLVLDGESKCDFLQ